MPTKLSTTIRKIELVQNPLNARLIFEFHKFMMSNRSSERHQNNNLKAIISYANYLGADVTLASIYTSQAVLSFLDTKIKTKEEDPDQKWVTTWNDYLHRIKHFLRWLHNIKNSSTQGCSPMENWQTPTFLQIKEKRTKRVSPYLESELWEKEDILNIIKYEPYKRNKAILSLLWDLDARPHEITLLKIKHIRLKEKYGEGEIPHEAKTGTGPILLTISFSYVRDWLNEHPFKNEPEARLICNLNNGSPISPDNIDKIMKQLRERIFRLLENGEINNHDERHLLEYLLKAKKWNPYCIRHSAITADSDYLPEYALKKKVRWSMNSKQGSRYIKRRMGNDLKQKILEFQVVGTDKMPSQDSDAVNLLDKIALDSTLEIDYWIGITSGLVRMKEHNWFFTTEPIENTNSGKRLWIITTSDWERNFSPPSVFEYLSSSVARCAIESLSRQLEHDETKKLKMHDIQLTKGCVFDFTTYKPYRRILVSNPYLCDECMEKLSLLEKLVHKKHSEFPLVNEIRALVSRDWMGNLKERDSPSYNLKKIYKCDIDRNSGFNKTLLEKLRDSIIDNTAQWIIGTAIGGIIAAIISIGVFLLTGIRT